MKILVNISFVLFLTFAFAMVGCKKMDIAPEGGVGMEMPTKKKVVTDSEDEVSVLNDLKNANGLNRGSQIDDDDIDWRDLDGVNDDDDAEEDDEQQTLVNN